MKTKVTSYWQAVVFFLGLILIYQPPYVLKGNELKRGNPSSQFSNAKTGVAFTTTSSGTFDFNDGTDQGWTLQGAYDENGSGPFSSSFVFGWKDPVNYPNPPGGDSMGDNNGSIQMFTLGGHGVTNPGATFWIMQFHSPDLSASSTWQSATGYTVEIAECMGTLTTMYANLYVKVYDTDQAKDRYFYSGSAQTLQHDVYGDGSADWNQMSFDWSGASNFPTNYIVKEVFVDIWGRMNGAFEGGVYLDEVVPTTTLQPPSAPSDLNLTVISSSEIDLDWQDNSDNEDGFKIERKTGVGGTWSQIGTVSANTTSYSDNGLSPNTAYYYRVCAYNTDGTSSYSNEPSATTLGSFQGGTFDFNDGTDQGWTLQGAYDENGSGPFSSSFVFGWKDPVNYPNPPGGDPMGDNNGSIQMFTLGGHGITNPGAIYWIMQFHSPDLTASSTWQSATGYTVEIAECMGTMTTMYTNLYVKVYDNDQAKDRYFYSGTAQPLQHDVYGDGSADWNQMSFDWSGASGFPTNYIVKEVFVNIWGRMNGAFEGGVYLDEVVPTTGQPPQTPAPPSNLQAFLLNDQIHITWQDNSDNETGFALEVKESPGIFPIQWRNLDTLAANTTSYQMDNPIPNHTYNFKVLAFNDEGSSAYSNIDTLNFGYSLIWIVIGAPNGGEIWSTGSIQQITWNTGTINPPSHVTIEYSTDGGSNWISPTVATNIPNTGSYSWTIPNTPSTNCIVKVKDAADGSPYDLSNHPFTITTSNPPVLAVSPTTLDFGTTNTSLDFQISNSGGDALNWDVAENPDKAWITSIIPNSGTNDGTVTVTVDRNQLSGTSDTGTIAVTSNGGNQNVTILISKEEGNLPESWDFTSNTGNSATVVLPTSANPNIDGTPLVNDDYIGVFTPTGLCCAYSQWEGENISIPIWGDNDQTPEIDGFQAGELINYRVYRTSEQKEWTFVTVAYSQGSGNYATNGFMVLSQFDVSETKMIAINLAQGWNMFSINVNPDDPNIETVMNPIVDKLVIVKNGSGQTYIPTYGINDIGNMNFGEGYQAYLNQAATLDITGQPVDPTTEIPLPAGWSIITYLPTVPMDVATALASISDQLIIAKNNAGQTYIPQYDIDDIGQMQPGQGYQVYLNASGTLIYPAAGGLPKTTKMLAVESGSKNLIKTLTDHFQFTSNTGENATIVIPVDIIPKYSDDAPLDNGDEIGVFTADGLCCGAVVWQNLSAAITVWGNNSQTDSIDGFVAGDTLHYRVWKKNADIEYPARVDYQTGNLCVYQANGFSVLTELVADLTTDVTDKDKGTIPSNFKLCQNYPNPFNMETTIVYQLPKTSEVILTVYDTQGHIVRRLIQGNKAAGSYTLRWDGSNQSGNRVASGIYFYRIRITGEKANQRSFTDIKKMVLMK